MKIEGRTFVVSGGSSGLGLAAVKDLLEAKAFVSIIDIATPKNLSLSPRLLQIQVDITDLKALNDAVERTVAWTKKTGARLGGVINCAGIGIPSLITGKNATALFDKTIAVNIAGTFHLSRLLVKHLIDPASPAASDGVIIMLSSTVAYEGHVGQVAYAGSKGAIRAMTLPMARELARYGIRVVSIAPGLFTTAMTEQFQGEMRDFLINEGTLHPKRFGAPEEFARTVRWILGCDYVNGETVKLTGGTRVPVKL
ncbi:3-hydroxy-acyl-CoA-dehydrogenase [Hymenopellis radicata]|nr:3-hydroxy-acyl-CoA-dehydrogenase [Hymenopellis radicata]